MKFLQILLLLLSAASAFTLPAVLQDTYIQKEAIHRMMQRAYNRLIGSIAGKNGGRLTIRITNLILRKYQGYSTTAARRMYLEYGGASADVVEEQLTSFISNFSNAVEKILAAERLEEELEMVSMMEEEMVAAIFVAGRKLSEYVQKNIVMTEEEELNYRYNLCLLDGQPPQMCKVIINS